MNTTTDLGCSECGEPWPIYTANCKGCEARAMLCFSRSEAEFHDGPAYEERLSPIDAGPLCVSTWDMTLGAVFCLIGAWIVCSGVWSVCCQLADFSRIVLNWL